MIKWIRRIIKRFIVWRIRRLGNKNLLIIDAIGVGFFAGLAAVLLKTLVYYIQYFLKIGFEAQDFQVLLFLYPAIGILLTVAYVQLFRNGKLGRGVSSILMAISRKAGVVEKDKMYSHVVSSAVTVGFGGSVGLEAPIVVTGSAIGSNVAKLIHVPFKERTLLLACGAAAGIAAIFNSPIAGVIFAVEVLLAEFTIPWFIPLIIASVTGTLVSKTFLGEDLLFFFLLRDNFETHEVPWYILLGIFTGLISVYFTRMTFSIEAAFQEKKNPYIKALAGGLSLGMLIFFFPPLYGEGYDSIKTLLSNSPALLLNNSPFYDLLTNNWFVLVFVAAVMMIKVFATSFTLGAGGNGGMFAPSLFVGAFSGYFFSALINETGLSTLSENNFTIVGMAGVMSAVLHAPMTAIFLIAEITGGYLLIVPLMIVSAISYFTINYFEPYSIYTKKLALMGQLQTTDKDKNVLNNLSIEKVIEKDLLTIPYTATLGDLIKLISTSRRNVFPVVNAKNNLMGIIFLDNIREVMFKPEEYEKIFVQDLMTVPPASVSSKEEMMSVMKKFDSTGAWNLPVIDNGIYVGFVSKANIFSKYRSLLIRQTGE